MAHQDFISVAEDLEYLQREWRGMVQGDTLRRGSVTLRLLVVDQLLGQAWRAAGFSKQPSIPATSLDDVIARAPGTVIVAFAGGGEIGLMKYGGLTASLPGARRSGSDAPPEPVYRPMPLSGFAESDCALIYGERVKRREIIKYFANVKGGAHLELSSKGRHREEELVKRIHKLENRIGLEHMDALLVELSCIGQAIANAPDMMKLASAIRAV